MCIYIDLHIYNVQRPSALVNMFYTTIQPTPGMYYNIYANIYNKSDTLPKLKKKTNLRSIRPLT